MKMPSWHFDWKGQPDAARTYWGCYRSCSKTYQAMKQAPDSSRYTHTLNGLVLMARAVYRDALVITMPLAVEYAAETIPMVGCWLKTRLRKPS